MNRALANEDMPFRICLVAHNAYGELARVDTGHAGGIERQTSMMARWLTNHGFSVSLITWDEGQKDGIEVEDVIVHKMCRREDGVRGLRFFWPRWTSLCGALKRTAADVYYYNNGDMGLGQVALWCRWSGKRLIYSVASNAACDVALPRLKSPRERWLYRYGLRRAESIVVQTEWQRRALQQGFGLESWVIPMPCETVTDDQFTAPVLKNPPSVLWVGRIDPLKRLEWLTEVARRCPEVTFDVVGAANQESDYEKRVAADTHNVSNMNIHGRVPRERMHEFYRKSDILCCTSSLEGFPNTFLEAWNLGVPVLTTFDPDGLVASRSLGWTANSVDEIVVQLKNVQHSPDVWRKASENARRFCVSTHGLESVMHRFVSVLVNNSGVMSSAQREAAIAGVKKQ